jgi:hypothetical protein
MGNVIQFPKQQPLEPDWLEPDEEPPENEEEPRQTKVSAIWFWLGALLGLTN